MNNLKHIEIAMEEIEPSITISEIEKLIRHHTPISMISPSDVGGLAAESLVNIINSLQGLINKTKGEIE